MSIRYKKNKENLVDVLDKLKYWVENNLKDKTIEFLFLEIDQALENTQEEFSDCFGTEGYEFSIFGID